VNDLLDRALSLAIQHSAHTPRRKATVSHCQQPYKTSSSSSSKSNSGGSSSSSIGTDYMVDFVSTVLSHRSAR